MNLKDIDSCSYSQYKQNLLRKRERKETPFCRHFRTVVFPLSVFPSKHPFKAYDGSSVSAVTS